MLEEKKTLIHLSLKFEGKHLIYYFCDSWPFLFFFRHYATYREKYNFFENHFRETFVAISSF